MNNSVDEVGQKRVQMQLRQVDQIDRNHRLKDGGPPTDNGAMEARIKALEDAVKELPTKADFAALRADMAEGREGVHKLLLENSRWTHTALVGMLSVSVIGIIGLLLSIWNANKPASTPPSPPAVAQPAQQPPIIINVPSAGAAAKP